MKKNNHSSTPTTLQPVLKYAAVSVFIALVLAWQGGVFEPKLDAGQIDDMRSVADVADTVEVREVHLPVIRRFTGSLRPRESVELAAKSSGEVIELNVIAGDSVKKDQRLMRVDSELAQAQRTGAEAALEIAKVELDSAERLLSHVAAAAKANALPKTEAINAQRVRDSAIRAVEQRRASLDAAETRLGYTEVTSPISGVVIDTLNDTGDFVVAGQPVILLYDPANLEVITYIPEDLAAFCTPGREMKAIIRPLGQTVIGKVRTRVNRVDPLTRTMELKLDIEPPPGALPGMYTEVEMQTYEEKALVVPPSSVGRLRGLHYVRVVNTEGRIDRRLVRQGREWEDQVEILAGLDTGDRVLTRYWSEE